VSAGKRSYELAIKRVLNHKRKTKIEEDSSGSVSGECKAREEKTKTSIRKGKRSFRAKRRLKNYLA